MAQAAGSAAGRGSPGTTTWAGTARSRLRPWSVAGSSSLLLVALLLAVVLGDVRSSGVDRPKAPPAASEAPPAASRAQPLPAPGGRAAERGAREAYKRLPLAFAPNAGQVDKRVRYYVQGAGFGFYFTEQKAVLSFSKPRSKATATRSLLPLDIARDPFTGADRDRQAMLDLRFLGASPGARLTAEHRGAGTVNHLPGADRSRWRTGLPTYGQLAYQGLWPGIDMHFRGQGGKLKYEFVLKPGASPNDIRLAYAGAKRISLGAGGGLLLDTPLGVLRDAAPRSYQRIGERKVAVKSRYSLKRSGDNHGYGFEVGSYDPRYPLVIDPGLAYSTFLGGSASEIFEHIALDRHRNAYVTGATSSSDFPITDGAYDRTYNGGFSDIFVTKLNPTGSALAYSTYLGGGIGQGLGFETPSGIAVDDHGSAYISGFTQSQDFPTTEGAYDRTLGGDADAFVTKLNPAGSALAYSTYLGGGRFENAIGGIAVDRHGNAYVTGFTESDDFPTSEGAFDPTFEGLVDVFVTKLNPTGSALGYSTYLGSGFGNGVAVDGLGNAYVAGATGSPDFPTTDGAFDRTLGGGLDAFVTKLNPAGSALAYSTLLGGAELDDAFGIAVDPHRNAYITGTTSSSDYPTTQRAYDQTFNGREDAFVTKLNPAGSALAYSTYLGGAEFDQGSGIAVDRPGHPYVTGQTDSRDFPTTRRAYDRTYNGGFRDAFVTVLHRSGTALAYSTYLGGAEVDEGSGIAVDGRGDAYVTGSTISSDYPTTKRAYDPTYNGFFERDAFVTKIEPTDGRRTTRTRTRTRTTTNW